MQWWSVSLTLVLDREKKRIMPDPMTFLMKQMISTCIGTYRGFFLF